MADMNVFVRLALLYTGNGGKAAAADLKAVGAAATQAGAAGARGAAGLNQVAMAARRVVPPAASAGVALRTFAGGAREAGAASSGAAGKTSMLATAADKVAASARRAGVALAEMNAAAKRHIAGIDPVKLAAAGRRDVLDAQRGSLGGLMTLAGLYYPIKKQGDYELALTRYGNVAGYMDDKEGTFADKIGAINQKLRGDAVATRQYAGDLLTIVDTLVARGMPAGDAIGAAKLLGKTATGTGAEAPDLAQMYYALQSNLGIGDAEMPKAFDVATMAGKLGGFELKDMAKWYPELTVGYGQMGQKGIDPLASLSAMLQVAREGASSPDKAANNIANIIQKLFIRETRKNFEKQMGMDFGVEMQKATQAGADPLIHLLGLVDDFMQKNGDNQFLLGDLFSDRQALDGLRVLLAKREKIDEIKKKALEASGTVDRDFGRVSSTLSMRAKGMMIGLDNLVNTLSQLPLQDGKGVFGWMESTANALDGIAKKSPEATGAVVNTGLAVLGLAVAGRAFKWLGGGLKIATAGVLTLGRALLSSGVAKLIGRAALGVGGGIVGGLVGGFAGLARAGQLAYRFAGALGVARLAARGLWSVMKVGLVIEGFTLAYENWDRLKALLKEPTKVNLIFPDAPPWLQRLLEWSAKGANAAGQFAHDIQKKRQDELAAERVARPPLGTPPPGGWSAEQQRIRQQWLGEKPLPEASHPTPRSHIRGGRRNDVGTKAAAAAPVAAAPPAEAVSLWQRLGSSILSAGHSLGQLFGAGPSAGSGAAGPAAGTLRSHIRGGRRFDAGAKAKAEAGPAARTAVANKMAGEGQAGAPPGITVQTNGPTVNFKQAPPSISISAPISITMGAADPGAVGAAVSSHLNSVARGALHDGAHE